MLFKFFESYALFDRLKIFDFSYNQREKFFHSMKLTKYKKGEVVKDNGEEGKVIIYKLFILICKNISLLKEYILSYK